MPPDKTEELIKWQDSVTPYYDRIDALHLDWPSQTCEWQLDEQTVIVATITNKEQDEYLRNVTPKKSLIRHPDHVKKEWKVPVSADLKKENEYESYGLMRVRQCPSNPEVIAGIADTGAVCVFAPNYYDDPAILNFHESTGFGLAWCSHPISKTGKYSKKQLLVTASSEGDIALWRIDRNVPKLSELHADTHANSMVNDVVWTNSDRIVLALENGNVLILKNTLERIHEIKLFDEGINCLSVCPFTGQLAVGTDSGAICVYSNLNGTKKVWESTNSHRGGLTCLKWSPLLPNVIASGGVDCYVCMWDISRSDDIQLDIDAIEGPPELIFRHSGHLNCGSTVADLDWHPSIPTLIASVDGSGVLMAWAPSYNLFVH